MPFKHHAKEVKSLALEPIGRVPHIIDGIHGRHIVIGRKHLEAHALVQADRQQLHYHAVARPFITAIAIGGIVHGAQVDHLLKLASCAIAQKQGRSMVVLGGHQHLDLAQINRNTLDFVTQGQRNRSLGIFRANRESGHIWAQARAIVSVRRIFCWSCKMPYTSASAVGGQPGTYTSTGTMRSQPRTTE